MDELSELWSEFNALPFPDRLPEDPGSRAELEQLSSTATDCIETYMMTGMLGPEENGALRACAIELERIGPQLDGDAADYFGRLAHLAARVMKRPNLPGYF